MSPTKELLNGFRIVKERRIRASNLGDIDLIVRGTIPVTCVKNALMIAEVTDDCWVFYEELEYDGEQRHYFEWFKKENDDIISKDYELPPLSQGEHNE